MVDMSASLRVVSEYNTSSVFRRPLVLLLLDWPELAHLDQGQLIIQNALWLVQAHPKIYPFLLLLTESWQEKACSYPARNCRITESENGENRWGSGDRARDFALYMHACLHTHRTSHRDHLALVSRLIH